MDDMDIWDPFADPADAAREGQTVKGPNAVEVDAQGNRGCGPSVRLVCFLASHLSSQERLDRFVETLDSIRHGGIRLRQQSGPAVLSTSWSATGHLSYGIDASGFSSLMMTTFGTHTDLRRC